MKDESECLSWHTRKSIEAALDEDLAWGDITTDALVPASQRATGFLVSKGEALLAGIDVAGLVFATVDPTLSFEALMDDGARIHAGDRVGRVEGAAAGILRAERTALNFLQRLSGIATETAKFVEAVTGTHVVITDTRKTTPGLRVLEKYAVRVGGGQNHRNSLGDAVLIKDNHTELLRARGITLSEAIKRARSRAPHTARIEIEAQTVGQALEGIAGRADIVMLDNMSLDDIRRVVELAGDRVTLEASGGIDIENVRSFAETGVNLISLGTVTHSAPAVDISLDLEV